MIKIYSPAVNYSEEDIDGPYNVYNVNVLLEHEARMLYPTKPWNIRAIKFIESESDNHD